MADGITLTCKLGAFTFDTTVRLSQAKRIRDEIMGQFFNPLPSTPRLRTEDECEAYIRNKDRFTELSTIPFELLINIT